MKNKKLILSLDKIMMNQKEVLVKKLKNIFSEVKYFYGSEKQKKDVTFYEKILKELNRKKYLKKYIISLSKKQDLKYYNKILKNFLDVDYVLMIGGIYYSKEFICLVKEKNPKIKFILFLWDKFDREKIKELKNMYDVIYTFEKNDATENNIKWRSSFYVDEKKDLVKDIDLYFLGENRDRKRYEYINRLYNFCMENGLSKNIKLFSSKKLKNVNPDIITYKKIPYEENLKNIQKTKVTFEKNIENQYGLSLRSLECLGYETKLITTNKDIKTYDFYNPENIYVIENVNDIDKIPISFFKEKYKKVDKEILKKYSFEGFIEEIFKNVNEE